MSEPARAPAFYAARGTRWRDWWTLLHPPYTLWHLGFVALGAGVAPAVDAGRLLATLVAFFLAVGVAAHALDELHDRPLGTAISDRALRVAAATALAGAAVIGIGMLVRVADRPSFAVAASALIAVGLLLVVGYNLELFGGRLHTHAGFAAAWGAFPVLVSFYAQAETLTPAALAAAAAAFAIAWAQRSLSNQARFVRRQTAEVRVEIVDRDGTTRRADARFVLQPIEAALHALSWGVVLTGAALVVSRLLG